MGIDGACIDVGQVQQQLRWQKRHVDQPVKARDALIVILRGARSAGVERQHQQLLNHRFVGVGNRRREGDLATCDGPLYGLPATAVRAHVQSHSGVKRTAGLQVLDDIQRVHGVGPQLLELKPGRTVILLTGNERILVGAIEALDVAQAAHTAQVVLGTTGIGIGGELVALHGHAGGKQAART